MKTEKIGAVIVSMQVRILPLAYPSKRGGVKMKKWEKDADEKCPMCGGVLEFLCDEKHAYAERCSQGCFKKEYD